MTSPALARLLMRLPEPLAALWLAGRRRRSGARVMNPKAQLVADFVVSVRVPGHVPEPAEARGQLRAMVAVLERPHPALARKEEMTIPGPGAPLPARLYAPRPVGRTLLPIVVFYHGGGWIQGDLETHDALCGKLAAWGECIVVAIDYRLAPEHKFPAAVDDCLAAFRWVVAHAIALGGEPERVAVGGDSAGGNLSAVVAQVQAAEAGPLPAAQLLIYPALDMHLRSPSHEELKTDAMIPRDRILFYRDWYLRSAADMDDPRASPALAADLAGLPPAYVVTCGFDPLRDEGRAYAERLAAAGVPAVHREWPGQIHAFTVITAVIPEGDACIAEIADWLKRTLAG